MLIYQGGNKPLKIKNVNTKSILFKAIIQMNAGLIALSDFDPSKITVKISLHRGGKVIVLQSSTLLVLWMRSAYHTGVFQSFRLNGWTDFLINATGLYMIPMTLDLGGWFNLEGRDTIHIETNFNAGFSANVNLVSSFLDIREERGQGVEAGVPMIRTESIEANPSRLSFALGDNVEEVMLICTNQAFDFTVASALFSTYSVVSDKKSNNYNYQDMLEKRMRQFEFSNQWQLRGQNWVLILAKEALHRVNIDIDFVSANIGAGDIYLTVKHFDRNEKNMTRAHHMNQKFALQNMQFMGMNDKGVQGKLEHHSAKALASHPDAPAAV